MQSQYINNEQLDEWLERAEVLLEMGNLELEERAAVENFGEILQNSDFFQFMEEANFPIQTDVQQLNKYTKA